jgi:phospholipid N-methyltransferase
MSRIISSFFKINSTDSITNYFPDRKHHLNDTLKSMHHRLLHFFESKIWINESHVCNFAAAHPNEKISKMFENKPLYRKLRRYESNRVVPEESLLVRLKNGLLFLQQFIKFPLTVGSLIPSSHRLAKAMIRQIPKVDEGQKRYILEVGPGTGVFTDQLIKRINPEDELHLVEFDHDFCEQLKQKYRHLNNVKIYEGSITDFDPHKDLKLPETEKYQFIISGLPFNSFKDSTVKEVLNKYKNICADGGKLSYFEYMLLPSIKKIFMDTEGVFNLNKILKRKQKFYDQHRITVDNVWTNFTPAKVFHHELKNQGPPHKQ